jgi:hypothetical protein
MMQTISNVSHESIFSMVPSGPKTRTVPPVAGVIYARSRRGGSAGGEVAP